jgi:hypothetical protein
MQVLFLENSFLFDPLLQFWMFSSKNKHNISLNLDYIFPIRFCL